MSPSHGTNILSLLKNEVLKYYNQLNYGNPKERKHYYIGCAYRIKLLHLDRLRKAIWNWFCLQQLEDGCSSAFGWIWFRWRRGKLPFTYGIIAYNILWSLLNSFSCVFHILSLVKISLNYFVHFFFNEQVSWTSIAL